MSTIVFTRVRKKGEELPACQLLWRRPLNKKNSWISVFVANDQASPLLALPAPNPPARLVLQRLSVPETLSPALHQQVMKTRSVFRKARPPTAHLLLPSLSLLLTLTRPTAIPPTLFPMLTINTNSWPARQLVIICLSQPSRLRTNLAWTLMTFLAQPLRFSTHLRLIVWGKTVALLTSLKKSSTRDSPAWATSRSMSTMSRRRVRFLIDLNAFQTMPNTWTHRLKSKFSTRSGLVPQSPGSSSAMTRTPARASLRQPPLKRKRSPLTRTLSSSYLPLDLALAF